MIIFGQEFKSVKIANNFVIEYVIYTNHFNANIPSLIDSGNIFTNALLR